MDGSNPRPTLCDAALTFVVVDECTLRRHSRSIIMHAPGPAHRSSLATNINDADRDPAAPLTGDLRPLNHSAFHFLQWWPVWRSGGVSGRQGQGVSWSP